MTRKFMKYSGFLLLVFLTACSSTSKKEAPQGFLATHIFDDGSKQFVYTLDLPEPAPRGGRGGGNGRPGNVAGTVSGGSNRGLSAGVTAGSGSGRGGKGGQKQQSKDGLLLGSLEAELENSGFCREGFMELDRMTEPSQTYIKGECVDAASEKDRSRFPNDM